MVHRRYLLAGSLALATLATARVRAQSQALAPAAPPPSSKPGPFRVEEAAHFPHQATGVAVSADGRIFVNFPRWTEDSPVSVVEVSRDGTLKPYPDEEWNSWRNAEATTRTARDHFVCVQSVVADNRGNLWVLDPASPRAGVRIHSPGVPPRKSRQRPATR